MGAAPFGSKGAVFAPRLGSFGPPSKPVIPRPVLWAGGSALAFHLKNGPRRPARSQPDTAGAPARRLRRPRRYNKTMERKVFWTAFSLLGLLADLIFPFWWAVGATLPIAWFSWWIAYRSEWF